MHGRQVAAHGADRERPGYITQEETLKVTRRINRALCSQLNASQPLTTTTRYQAGCDYAMAASVSAWACSP